ncbi:hypothetical protein [Demequina sp. NBRC 110053]|uniref:hypothetical protein n=1 Tax=Demequina sp. NBRC 110053 TaxID=1570342 RepID=UPI0013564065|nr:hypothetical protein [Demequina sp. NBRC 110053]
MSDDSADRTDRPRRAGMSAGVVIALVAAITTAMWVALSDGDADEPVQPTPTATVSP